MTIHTTRAVRALFRSYRSYKSPCYSRQWCHSLRTRPDVIPRPPLYPLQNAGLAPRGMSTSQARPKASSTTSASTSTETNPATLLGIDGEHGQEHYYIQRSYPKGKPEKLMSGLQRLLSFQTPAATTESSQPVVSKLRWSLSSSGDAIHLAFTLSSQEHIDRFIEALKRESDTINHHPHISHQHCNEQEGTVLAVTCTTHVPHGLSLKDVKLADQVNDVLNNLEREHPNCIGVINDHSITRPLAESLIHRNKDEARSARENPHSVCHTATTTAAN